MGKDIQFHPDRREIVSKFLNGMILAALGSGEIAMTIHYLIVNNATAVFCAALAGAALYVSVDTLKND
jgi:hypothetical protein